MAGFRHFDVTYNKILQKSRLFFGNLPFYVVVTVRVLRTATGAHQSNFWNGLRERGTGLMSLRDVRSQGLGRITAIIAAMMIALATMFAFMSMPQQALAADDSQTNFDSWTEVAANIEKQLETAEQDYNDGNYYQAGTDFQNAHWVGYDASNFSKVVNDTIGADKQKARRNAWRIPEKTLILSAVIGGSVGAILGMRFFHHKTRKAKFAIGVPVILLVQIGAMCLVQWAMK